MKRTFKKTISLVLAVLMVFTALPLVGATAKCATCNYTYTYDGDGWHQYRCATCGDRGFVKCSGGVATCKSGAICDGCKTEYTAKSDSHGTPILIATEEYLSSAANCKYPAYYYLSCMDCGDIYEGMTKNINETLDPNNHQYVYATTNNNGTHNAKCGFCDATKTNEACRDAEPAITGATCTTGGKKVNTCDVCNYVWEESIAALGHSYTKKSGVRRSEATCTAFDTYWYMCANEGCGANAKDDANAQDKFYNGTDKKGHKYDQTVQNENTIKFPATCQQEATYYYSCVCGAIDSTGRTFTTTTGTHSWGNGIYNNDAKCGVNGTMTVTCMIPGCGATDIVEAPNTALTHVFSRELQYADRIRTTGNCQVNNTYWKTCARCDDVWSDTAFFTGTTKGECNVDGTTINESNIYLYNKVPATCTTLAIFYKYCTVCGTSSAGKPYEATFTFGTTLNHTYIEKIEDQYIRVQATCDTGAIYSKSCAVCGVAKVPFDVDVRDPNANVSKSDVFEGSKLGHDFKSTKAYKDSSCVLEGNYEEFTCQRVLGGQVCGHKTGGEVIPKKEHAFKVTQEFRAPTCKINGQYGQKKCDGCGTIVFLDANGETANLLTQNMMATGHLDSDGDMICEKCDALLEAEDLCGCMCHMGDNGGIMYFVIWILKWFWKLTGRNEMCECGKAHY